eukprot:2894479-Heterocapsa_arctica.AAC.1
MSTSFATPPPASYLISFNLHQALHNMDQVVQVHLAARPYPGTFPCQLPHHAVLYTRFFSRCNSSPANSALL